ncbi:hypothetical protein BDZ97DRAFT_62449 [Flammula alnicola]|nr:hypothetical protein BDZ97DRAFT_62449 [Flammula alnicola]
MASLPKKRKLDTQPSGPIFPRTLISDVNAEVDLEIALRQQLTETLESRITWGLILQKAIQNASQETFRSVALDALSVLESPSLHILGQDPTPPPLPPHLIPRPPPRKAFPSSFKPKPSFLYTRSNPVVNAERTGHRHLYILKCPGCSRTTFTSLQGLLNHARLTHNLEWGTHDECIRACAVVDNDLDVEAGIEVALGPSGVLPGLRTIFQMAVGAQNRGKESLVGLQTTSKPTENQDLPPAGNHLNRTLGLHEDSPSLAPFLGKEAIRRQIKVWDEDEEIDVENGHGSDLQGKPQPKRPWKMPFAPRNFAENFNLEPVNNINESVLAENGDHVTNQRPSLPVPALPEHIVSNQSRFHFIARIVVADRSLSVPEEQRLEEYKNYTHKWMISVDAPSYAHHITSVLKSVRVTPSDPRVSIPAPPPTTNPPFVVVGLSDKPFLARVELSFSGTSSDELAPSQKVVFEHWVDLDPLKNRDVVLGQEQVLDVELDKNTVLKPPQLGYIPIDSKSLWNQMAMPRIDQVKITKVEDTIETSSVPPLKFNAMLAKIAKRFPMTLSDFKGSRSQSTALPYRLVSSPAYFKTLVVGRRKAIEWGCARAIRDAYNQQIQNLQDQTLVPLTAADVYSWLSDNGHFPKVTEEIERPLIKQEISEVKEEESNALQGNEELNHWCRICGMDTLAHTKSNSIMMEHSETEETKPRALTQAHEGRAILAPDGACGIMPRALQIAKLPRLDIQQLTAGEKSHPDSGRARPAVMDRESLVSVADPLLTLSIRGLVDSLRLSKFRALSKTADAGRHTPSYPLDGLGDHRLDIEKNLAPYGLLALVTKSFVRVLVERGLEVANPDKVVSAGVPLSTFQEANAKASAALPKTTRMLTPTHILSGILTQGRGRSNSHDALDAVVPLFLSKLGIAVDPDTSASSCQGELKP